MSSGYTAGVSDGEITEFDEFALQCSRAMGACIEQRDDDPSEPPKLQKYSSYYEEILSDKRKKLEDFLKLTLDEYGNKRKEELKNSIKALEEQIEKSNEILTRYLDMKEKVEAWAPPTPDHEGLKTFMLRQLEDSIQFDCISNYYLKQIDEYKYDLAHLGENVSQMYEEEWESLSEDIKIYEKQLAKDLMRHTERNN